MRTLAITALMTTLALPAAAQDWQKSMKDLAKQQAQTQMETKLNLPKPAPAGAEAYFCTLKDGATVSNPVAVQFCLKNAGVAPAGTQGDSFGHHHLLIDNPTVDYAAPLPMTDKIKHFGGGQTETILTLSPGKHTLQLLFADWKHQPFNPSVQSAPITITVK